MINPITWIADRLAAHITDYPRVTATRDCEGCGAQKGNQHRLAGCEGNERDVRRGYLVNYPGEKLSDAEVDRRQAEALEQHRRNMKGEA
ncbi:hypothetical protein ACQP2Y_21155 [Actinoplanes sp. CA-051413]|uniref:hypothetical protein n=1 Tax=Actinoplanes sp. CA-051413 TaxID=3239899 RepID=UPI003D957E61